MDEEEELLEYADDFMETGTSDLLGDPNEEIPYGNDGEEEENLDVYIPDTAAVESVTDRRLKYGISRSNVFFRT